MKHEWARVIISMWVVAACAAAVPAYGASIVIGGDYMDVGTIIFVSPKAGDTPAANGAALLNALNGITDNGEANRYLIKVGPGVYDLGTCDTSGASPYSCVLYMKEYVDIEGSGETVTKITSGVYSAAAPLLAGTIMGASNAELRFLTAENTATTGLSAAIMNSGASPSLLHVTALSITSGGTTKNGISNSGAAPTMVHVTATGAGGTNNNLGIRNFSSSPIMRNVSAGGTGGLNSYGVRNLSSSSPTMAGVTATASGGSTVSYGVSSDDSASAVKISHSVIMGDTTSIFNGAATTAYVAHSELAGAAGGTGTFVCMGVYDAGYVALSATCQPASP